MSAEVIESYLVALGFEVNQPQLKSFQSTLKSAQTSVSSMTSGVLADFLKFQVAGTTAFTAVGFGVLGFLDKLAMGDQRMRLFAMRSFMTIQQARSVQTALSVLGASIDDVSWDKELHKRFTTLIQDQRDLTKMLGPGYEKQMADIRDVTFQLQRLEVKGEYFGMKFASDLLGKLGFGNDGILKQLERLNDFVLKNMPEWSDELSSDIVPVLKDFWGILKDLGMMAKVAAEGFEDFEGILTGDTSLQKGTGDFHSFAKAVGDAAHQLAFVLHLMLDIEKVAVNLGAGVAAGLRGIAHPSQLFNDTPETRASNAMIRQHLTAAWGGLGNLGDDLQGNTSYDGTNGSVGTAGTPAASLKGFLDTQEWKGVGFEQLSHALMMTESGGNQGAVSKVGAIGKYQLMPSTAAGLGVNAYDPADNQRGGEMMLHSLLNHYGAPVPALMAYNWGQGNVDSYLKTGHGLITKRNPTGAVPGETMDYVRRIAGRLGVQNTPFGGSIEVHLHGVPGESHQLTAAVKKGVSEAMAEHEQRLMAESSGPYN